MMSGKGIRLAGLTAMMVAACTAAPAATEAPESLAPTSAPAQPTQAPPQPTAAPPSGGGLGVDSVNLCDVLPPAEFADLAGGTPYSELTAPGPSCSYVIDPGDGAAASYHTFLYTPETIRPLMDYVRDYESADWIEGYGDSAYIQDSVSGGGYVLIILVGGQYGLEVGGPDKDVLQATARVIMERVDP
jgi:hypothetical protein